MNEPRKQKNREGEFDEFAFEVNSSLDTKDVVNRINPPEPDELEKSAKQTTIKILAERDIQIKEKLPPNFSHKFICVLHFKGGNYKDRKLLQIANTFSQERI